jgi:ATP-dependent Clp protease adaptor protein ClpS
MADEHADQDVPAGTGNAGTATLTRTETSPPAVDRLPPWKVLLHDDDVNDIQYVVDTVHELTTLRRTEAILRTFVAHHTGISLLLSTHREHAELLEEQFASKRLKVTIEPGA